MRIGDHIRSNVIGCLALFFALSGVGYAAATIGSRDVIDGSLLGRDVNNGALQTKDLAPDAVRSLYLIEDFSRATANASGEFAESTISYPLALRAAPQLHFIAAGQPSNVSCPGAVDDPKAAPGQLCVYENGATNRDPGDVAFHFGGGRDRLGFGLSVLAASSTPGLFASNGSWAVTAP
ncbi:MAG: hypothetical protein H0W09_04330 [Solirubrobacterales bacterium]|nr:hypothetical protein [Solirubrobacterales bacterium]